MKGEGSVLVRLKYIYLSIITYNLQNVNAPSKKFCAGAKVNMTVNNKAKMGDLLAMGKSRKKLEILTNVKYLERLLLLLFRQLLLMLQ